jgi:hypothetical protein
MPSPWRERVYYLFTELEALFKSEFGIFNPFQYDDINPGERYGFISFEQFDIDRNLQATETFKAIRGSFIICDGCATEAEAKIKPLQLMFDLDNFSGVVQTQLVDAYGLLYQFRVDPFQPVTRTLRQPIRRPDVWISDVTGGIEARIAIDHEPSGLQKYP